MAEKKSGKAKPSRTQKSSSSRRSTSSRAKKSASSRKSSGSRGAKSASSRKGSRAAAKLAAAAPQSFAFKSAYSRATEIVSDGRKAGALATKAATKMKGKEGISEVADDLHTLIRMIRAYAKGDYREIPWTTIVAATAAVVYFVNPIDVIPDTIPGVGYVDDVTVILFVIASIENDLDAFRGWEARTGGGPGGAGAGARRKPKQPKGSPGATAK